MYWTHAQRRPLLRAVIEGKLMDHARGRSNQEMLGWMNTDQYGSSKLRPNGDWNDDVGHFMPCTCQGDRKPEGRRKGFIMKHHLVRQTLKKICVASIPFHIIQCAMRLFLNFVAKGTLNSTFLSMPKSS